MLQLVRQARVGTLMPAARGENPHSLIGETRKP